MKGEQEGDPYKLFLESISNFGKAFQQGVDDLNRKRLEQEKSAKVASEKAEKQKKAEIMRSSDIGDEGPVSGDNIFAKFHQSQAASTDSVIAEFRKKMLRKQIQSQKDATEKLETMSN